MTDSEQRFGLPTTAQGWRTLFRELGIQPSKGLGQNFLIDSSQTDRIAKAADLQPDALVVEVGPGLGILTASLVRKAEKVIAIEQDSRLAEHVRQTFPPDRVQTVTGDALAVDIEALVGDRPYHLVSNLPYSSGTAIIRRFLELPRPPESTTVMLQLEVAKRLVAPPGDLSVVGVATQVYAEGDLLFTVPPTVFIPSPKIDSGVVRLRRLDQPWIREEERVSFFKLVNAGFHYKRKTVANSLALATEAEKLIIADWLQGAGIESGRRAESLSIPEWVRLYRSTPAGWSL